MSRTQRGNSGFSLSRRTLLANSALAALFGATAVGPLGAAVSQAAQPPATSLPWRNWSGGVQAQPAGRFSPATESVLADFLAGTKGPVRPVGSGHSFTPLVPTDGTMLVLDQLLGLLGHNSTSLQATFAAGTRLGELGGTLDGIGQAMLNLPDIDRQTLAGAIATATHGTGIGFQCLSGYVRGLRLVTPAGEVLDLDAQHQPDLFNAARVSLGALGIVTRVTMQNRTPYRLKARSAMARIDEVLVNFDSLAANHRHFEMFPLVHSDYAITLAIDETDDAINNPPESLEEAAAFGQAMQAWSAVPAGQRRPYVNGVAEQISPTEVVDQSWKILSNVRNNRFNEMEYSVPLHAGAACLREVLDTISKQEIDVVFPLEYRYVQGDDTWLGMSAGSEDHASISIHRTAEADYRPYFNAIEPIFHKYGGRPHWGKVHGLGHAELSELYPRFEDFRALRQQLDPQGRLLNPHLRKLFGVPA